MEHKQVDSRLLQRLSEQCMGDIRSSIRDLQAICSGIDQVKVDSFDVLGDRDRSKTIFDLLQKIFLTKDIEAIKQHTRLIDEDPNNIILWVDENLPRTYSNIEDLVNGYRILSTADVFLGRVYHRNNYGFWSYASDLMSIGIAITRRYPGRSSKYMFPQWLINLKQGKNQRNIRNQVIDKLAKYTHCSKKKASEYVYHYFQNLCRKNMIFRDKMIEKLDLNEEEVIFLVGRKLAKNIMNKENDTLKITDKKSDEQQKLL